MERTNARLSLGQTTGFAQKDTNTKMRGKYIHTMAYSEYKYNGASRTIHRLVSPSRPLLPTKKMQKTLLFGTEHRHTNSSKNTTQTKFVGIFYLLLCIILPRSWWRMTQSRQSEACSPAACTCPPLPPADPPPRHALHHPSPGKRASGTSW